MRDILENEVDVILDVVNTSTSINPPSQLNTAEKILTADTPELNVSVTETNRDVDVASGRRMRRTTFQARLGRRLDSVQRRVLDNNLRLSSHPTDMLRISINRDPRSRDILSRTLNSMEIMPIIFPKMEKLPLRHLEGYRKGNEVVIPSLYTIEQNEYFELYAPVECKLKLDDLLVRIVYDDVNCPDDPYVMILQVSEQLATIGYSSIRYYTFWATFYNENLPDRIIETIKSDQIKRSILGW